MRFSAFDTIVITAHRDGLPARIEQRASSVRALLKLAFLLAVFIALCIPYLALGLEAARDAMLWDWLAARPGGIALALSGLGCASLLLGMPALECFRRLGRARSIVLANGHVEVFDRHLLRASSWGCPLADFIGVAHHVRTRVGSTRDELILVHPDAERCLLLRTGNAISLDDAQVLARLLGLPVVPASVLYAHHRLSNVPASQLTPELGRIEAR